MKICTKDEANAILGKVGFFTVNGAPGSMRYLQGVAEFDEVASKTKEPTFYYLSFRPNGLLLSIASTFKKYYVAVSYTELQSVSFETPEDIIAKKDKSVVGRAVVGGLLLGPVGAIVGGMSGLKDGIEAKKQDSLLTVVTQDADGVHYIVSQVKRDSVHDLVVPWLKKHLGQYYTEA